MNFTVTLINNTELPDSSVIDRVAITLVAHNYVDVVYKGYTDQNGTAVFENIVPDEYNLFASKKIEYLSDSVTVIASGEFNLSGEKNFGDSLAMDFAKSSSLIINEIYYAGPENDSYYFYDQFVELYNPAPDTAYLDGMMLCRAYSSISETLEDVDYCQVQYVFQFPGTPLTGKEYPVAPGEFVVIALDAIDHSQEVSSAIDLSQADWEFYDSYSGSDTDNENVPNVEDIRPEVARDFLLSLVRNAVILADGAVIETGESVDNLSYPLMHIPLEHVVDAVEYNTSVDGTKTITVRLDKGLAGNNLERYKGMSVERRYEGFDNNNSTIDFINLDSPTPGYIH